MARSWLLFVDGRLTGIHYDGKPTDLAAEYESEGHEVEMRPGRYAEAHEIWRQKRSESARKGWETRRKKVAS